jgi:hypothetical protein
LLEEKHFLVALPLARNLVEIDLNIRNLFLFLPSDFVYTTFDFISILVENLKIILQLLLLVDFGIPILVNIIHGET